MKLVKLHQFDQSTFLKTGGGPSKGGVCYYMCNYVEQNIWLKPETYDKAREVAKAFTGYTAMMNYAKSQNVQNYGQKDYAPLKTKTFAPNCLYRVAIWIGTGNAPDIPNHELILVTGGKGEITFFDPNFGFYEIQETSVENVSDFGEALDSLYFPYNWNTANYEFLKVRTHIAARPLSFDRKR